MKNDPAFMEQWWAGIVCMLFWAALVMSLSRCHGEEVTVTWNPNPEPNITHYRVWRGLDLLGETADTRLRIDLPTDQPSTLTVTAHSAAGSSPHSKPLVLAPAMVYSSADLRVWVVEKSSVFFQTLERDGVRTSRQFFRVNYHTP